MRLKSLFVLLSAAAAMGLVAAPADAARKKSRYVTVYGESRDLPGVRARYVTRLTVSRRSYLDAGTEVTPGTRKFTDYVLWPNEPSFMYNNWPSTFLNFYGRTPLPGTFFPWP
jgi:hypothetical protein